MHATRTWRAVPIGLALLLFGAACPADGQQWYGYHAGKGTLPDAQGWGVFAYGSPPAATVSGGVLHQGPTGVPDFQSWFQQSKVDLDLTQGVTAAFDLRVISSDLAPWNVLNLTGWSLKIDDSLGRILEVGVAQNTLKLDNDGFGYPGHAIYVGYDKTGDFHHYVLTTRYGNARLYVDGAKMLELPIGAIETTSPVPYIHFGDDSPSCSSETELRDVSYGAELDPWGSAAAYYVAHDLTPPGWGDTCIYAVSGGQQVGSGLDPKTGNMHALLWSGSADSYVDLHPDDPTDPRHWTASRAYGICGGEVVGYGDWEYWELEGRDALAWHGSAESFVDLNTTKLVEDFEYSSMAWATNGGTQVGMFGQGDSPGGGYPAAWTGTADSQVNLGPTDVPLGLQGLSGTAYAISGGQIVGAVQLWSRDWRSHGAMWSPGGGFVDMNPPGYWESSCYGTNGVQQVGAGCASSTSAGHAMAWSGGPGGVIDLQQFLPSSWDGSGATCIASDGTIGGNALDATGVSHAVLWVPLGGTSAITSGGGSYIDLNPFLPTGLTWPYLSGVDAGGVAVAFAQDAGGGWHALLWTPDRRAADLYVPWVGGVAGQTVRLSATMSVTGLLAAGVRVHFAVDEKYVGDATTDATGYACIDYAIPADMEARFHPIGVTYDGNNAISPTPAPAKGILNVLPTIQLTKITVYDLDTSEPSSPACSVSINGAPTVQLPFCAGPSADTIHCEVKASLPSGGSIAWTVTPDPSSCSVSSVTDEAGSAPWYDFNLTGLPGNYTGSIARPALSFTVVATGLDASNNVVATSNPVTVVQSDLGQLRQEYADRSIQYNGSDSTMRDIPTVWKFAPALHNDPGLNTGDYSWAILTKWAFDAIDSVRNAGVNGADVQVNSVYRNPAHNASLDGASKSSPHLYGEAVDFQVFHWPYKTIDNRTESDWDALARVCTGLHFVIEPYDMSTVSHVHIETGSRRPTRLLFLTAASPDPNDFHGYTCTTGQNVVVRSLLQDVSSPNQPSSPWAFDKRVRPVTLYLDGVAVNVDNGGYTDTAGIATATIVRPALGSHKIEVSYDGSVDSRFDGSDATCTLSVEQATAFSLYPASGSPGKPVTLKALVYSAGQPATGIPVDFTIDASSGGATTSPVDGAAPRSTGGILAGTATSDAGVASLQWTIPADMAIGTHTVTASFAGDATHAAFSRTTPALTVAPAAANLLFSQYAAGGTPGQTVTLRTMVYSGGVAISGLPIKFAVDGGYIGTATTDATGASLGYIIPATMAFGAHNVTVSFAGSTAYNPASRTTAALNVLQKVLFSQYASSGAPGDTVTLKTMVLSGGTAVSGLPIKFAVDGLAAGTATSGSGGASLLYHIPTTMPAGAHSVTVSFAGNATYASGSRTTAALTVGIPKANVTLSQYPASGSAGQTVTLRTLVYSGGVVASGLAIAFAVDGNPAGSATSDASGASTSYAIPAEMTVGVHNVTVSFAGDATHSPATRTTAALTVK